MAITEQHFQAITRQHKQAEPVGSPAIAILLSLVAWVAAIAVAVSVGQVAGMLSGVLVLFGVPAAWLALQCCK